MRHHTKDKGDIGVGFVIADLISKGIQVSLPLSEHLPFDLIAIYPDNTLKRVSIKYRAVARGSLHVALKSTYSDSKGTYSKRIDKKAIDLIAIYCPDTGKVYYVDHSKFNLDITLRIRPSKNNQIENVHNADDYLVP